MPSCPNSLPGLFATIFLGLALTGCGGGADDAESSGGDASAEPSASSGDQARAESQAPTEAPDDGIARVLIGSTDQMQYTVREFSVEAGQTVELTLEHRGRLEARVMGHNVVILQAGENTSAFGAEVMQNGGAMDNDYLPEDMRGRVIAYTAMIGGGDSTTVEFIAPEEPGTYPFLCTFPGHYGAMTGTMTVL